MPVHYQIGRGKDRLLTGLSFFHNLQTFKFGKTVPATDDFHRQMAISDLTILPEIEECTIFRENELVKSIYFNLKKMLDFLG